MIVVSTIVMPNTYLVPVPPADVLFHSSAW
jgi:hypothetical protein